jgi:DNA-binding MarR family transcriptional regulator
MTSTLREVGLAVKRLQWLHHREANRRLAPVGLSLAQWDVLRHLGEHPDASLHDLAMLTFQTDQSMGALAARMVERDLLERVDGPGRAVRHRLTADGERLRDQGAEVLDAVLAGSLGRLSPEDLATLHRLLLISGAGPPALTRPADPAAGRVGV